MLRPLAFMLALATLPATADAAPFTLSSGVERVALVELYTSEGCSSCPPADRWMSGLKADPDLWRAYSPIAFHVDYWDYIGWKDRFASASHSARQRQYAREGGARAVYTPGFFRDGLEWRDWRAGSAPIGNDSRVGDLRIRIDGTKIDVAFDALDTQPGELTVHVAVLGMGLQTQVKDGENRGRLLNHDFVALALASTALTHGDDGFVGSVSLPHTDIDAGDRAIVAWVSRARAQAPLQSVGGYLTTDDRDGGR